MMCSTPIIGFITLVCFVMQFHSPLSYAVDSSDRTSAIEKRQQFLDRFCIGICPKGPVGTEDIEDGAITTPKIADNAVTGNKIDGISKLIYSTCSIEIPSIETAPFSAFCPAPEGAENGDRVIANLQLVPCCPAPVFVGAAVFQTSPNDPVQVAFGFINPTESEPTSAGNTIISFMIFKER